MSLARPAPQGVVLNPEFTPHDYQDEAFRSAWSHLDGGKRSTLCAMATGLGKSCLGGMMAAEQVERRTGWCLFLAHRDELLQGARDDFDFVGVPTALEKAKRKAWDEINAARSDMWHPREIRTVVASVQTLKGSRLAGWDRDQFDLVITDEVHHSIRRKGGKKKGRDEVMPSYGAIYSHFGRAKLFGLTGSPDRGDGSQMGSFWESLCYSYMLGEAIDEGDLCRIVERRCEVAIDLSAVKVEGARLNQGDLEDAVAPYLQRMCNGIREELGDRRFLVFCPGRDDVRQEVRPCQSFASGLEALGIRAAAVWGDDPKRAIKVAAFRAGEYQALCCADLFNEGVNFPFVDGIALCSPTESPVVLGQRIGRGTRRYAGKTECRVVTFDWQFAQHHPKVMEPYELFRPAGTERALKVFNRMVKKGDVDLRHAMDEAERIAAEEERREKAEELNRLKRESAEARQKRLEERPVEVRLRVADSGLDFRTVDYRTPLVAPGGKVERCPRPWVEVLCGFGYPRKDAVLLDEPQCRNLHKVLWERHVRGLATPIQIHQLVGLRVKKEIADAMTSEQAGREIMRRVNNQRRAFVGRRKMA